MIFECVKIINISSILSVYYFEEGHTVHISTDLVTNYRNKKIAHNDFSVNEKVDPIDHLTLEMLERVLTSLRDFLNTINLYFNQSKKVYTYPLSPLTSELFKSLYLAKTTKNYIYSIQEEGGKVPEELVIDKGLFNFKYEIELNSVFQKTSLNKQDLKMLDELIEKNPKSLIFKKK